MCGFNKKYTYFFGSLPRVVSNTTDSNFPIIAEYLPKGLKMRRKNAKIKEKEIVMLNTTLCYIERDGAYLMLHRIKKQNDMNKDKWLGVGGKLEAGESPHECATREIFEETGVVASGLRYRGIVTFVSNEYGTEYMHLFTASGYEGEISYDCDEGRLEWVKKEDVRNLPIWEGDKIFFDLLDSDSPFFSLKLVYEGDRLVFHKVEY